MTDSAEVTAYLQQLVTGTFMDRMGIEIREAEPGRVVATMPVDGNTQPHGLLHGGATVVLAETVGSFAASIHAAPDRVAVGTEINATHHRGVRQGHVTATATALHEGRRVASYEITVVDDDGRRVCTARLTCMLTEQPATSGPPAR